MVKCPKCRGLLVCEPVSFRAPVHVRCLICGFYEEQAPVVVMPEIPAVTVNAHKTTDMDLDERREYNRAAQRRYRAKVDSAVLAERARVAAAKYRLKKKGDVCACV